MVYLTGKHWCEVETDDWWHDGHKLLSVRLRQCMVYGTCLVLEGGENTDRPCVCAFLRVRVYVYVYVSRVMEVVHY